MPLPYVKKLADEHGMSVSEAERRWAKAKKVAEKEGHGEDYAYITGVFQKMMGETSTVLSRLMATAAGGLNFTSPVKIETCAVELEKAMKGNFQMHSLGPAGAGATVAPNDLQKVTRALKACGYVHLARAPKGKRTDGSWVSKVVHTDEAKKELTRCCAFVSKEHDGVLDVHLFLVKYITK